MTRHECRSALRIIDGQRGWRITCSCGETWLRKGPRETAIARTFDLHLRVLAAR